MVTAGRIVLQQPENDLAKQHFKALQGECVFDDESFKMLIFDR